MPAATSRISRSLLAVEPKRLFINSYGNWWRAQKGRPVSLHDLQPFTFIGIDIRKSSREVDGKANIAIGAGCKQTSLHQAFGRTGGAIARTVRIGIGAAKTRASVIIVYREAGSVFAGSYRTGHN